MGTLKSKTEIEFKLIVYSVSGFELLNLAPAGSDMADMRDPLKVLLVQNPVVDKFRVYGESPELPSRPQIFDSLKDWNQAAEVKYPFLYGSLYSPNTSNVHT